MKISREYILGLGSGLIISAMLSLLLPAGTVFIPRSVAVADSSQSGQAPDAQPVSPSQPKPAGEDKPQDISANMSGDNHSIPSNNNETVNANGNPPQGSQAGQATGRQFVIPSGATAGEIADLLAKQGYITDKEQFLTLVKQQGAEGRFRAGAYNLTEKLKPDEIIAKLLNPPG